MGWPKGVPRKHNIDKESAVNPFQPKETVMAAPEVQPSGDKGPGQEPPPHLIENTVGFRPFNDRSALEDKYAEFQGLDTQGEQKMETAEDKQGTPPPTEADTGGEKKTSETIEVRKDEPVVAATSTPGQQPATTPELPLEEKYKTKEDAIRGAKEAERKMHEATQERSKIESEKKSLEAFNKQMMEVLTAMKTSQGQPVVPKQEENIELTPEQKTELIINNPNEFERLVTEKAKREILGEIETRQKRDQEGIAAATKQRGIELFVRVGEQHFEANYQDMKVYEPYVKEEAEKILKSDGARELISQKGPQGLIDQAVINTKARIEQIRSTLMAGATPPAATSAAPVNSGEVRTPIPASPVVKPSGIIPSPVPQAPQIPTGAEIAKDYVDERNAWRAQRGLA